MSSAGRALRREQLRQWFERGLPFTAIALFLVALLGGGGGAEAPLPSGMLGALGAGLLLILTAAHFTVRPLPSEAATAIVLILATLLLIAAQLVPLPNWIWSSLPGRDGAAQLAQLIDPGAARPLSLDPEATRLAATALLLPAALLLGFLATPANGILWFVRALVLAATLSALLGAAQLALGTPPSLSLYGAPVEGAATGVFANRNHHADLLLAGMVAAAVLIRTDRGHLNLSWRGRAVGLHYGWALLPLFAAMTLATTSRAGAGLLAVALPAALVIALGAKRGGRPLIILAALILVAGLAMLLTPGGTLAAITARAELGINGELRLLTMPDLLFTLGQYWPAGSGLGTFDPVYRINENLDLVRTTYLNHAHNDFLELMIEAGVAGLVLAALVLLTIAARLVAIVRGVRTGADPTLAMAGASILLILLLHSVVDYPLRTDALAALFAVALGMVLARPVALRPADTPTRSARPHRRSRR